MPAVDPAATARALYDALAQTLRDSGAEDQLDEVVNQFLELARGSGPREALITSAVPLTPEQQTGLVQQLQAKYSKALVIKFEVDPAILGGLIVRVGDRVLDESVRSRLIAVQQGMLTS
ncbi:MAG TPA: ATP synthase F1 subunit delta [Herpetosiphonaceae bacterium]